jgi:hypothetical protein
MRNSLICGFVCVALFVATGAVSLRAAAGCEKDTDCKGDRICYEGACVASEVAEERERVKLQPAAPAASAPPTSGYQPVQQPVSGYQAATPAPYPLTPAPSSAPTVLTASQAVLSVVINSKKVTEADVYVDGQLVGQVPWQGVVVAGEHTVRVVPKNAYGPKEKSTRVWPQRTRVVEFGSFSSNDQRTWTEWIGIRAYGGFSAHQWFWNDPEYSCANGKYFDPEWDNPSANCDHVVGKPAPWDYLMDIPTFLVGGEMSLFTLRWTHFYWEILHAGGGYPVFVYWGTAFGIPIHFDKSEIRLGAHLTMLYGFYPSPSGLELYWVAHVARRFAVEIGLKQFSFPFALGATLGFRI